MHAQVVALAAKEFQKLKFNQEHMLPSKENTAMATAAQKSALTALAAASAAMAAATQALVASFADEGETPEPVKAPKKKPAETPAPAVVEPKKEEPVKPAAAAPTPAAAPAADIAAQARRAAVEYSQTFGREGLKEVLGKFTTGTLADIPAEKLGEFIAALKA